MTTIKPPASVYLWVCPKGHISNGAIPATPQLRAVCWTCYPGGRRNNMEIGPAEAELFSFSPTEGPSND